jgi:hypothetical protein
MRKQILAFLLVASCGGSKAATTTPPVDPVEPVEPTPVEPEPVVQKAPTVEEAQAFAARVDADLRALWVEQSIAEWENSTNITDETDKNRARYHRQYYQGDWTDPANYHLVLNTAALGLDGAAAVIVGRAKALGWGPGDAALSRS